jgi:AmmeMemoRadiSam system protein A
MSKAADQQESIVRVEQGQVVLLIARAEITKAFDSSFRQAIENYAWLEQKGACFVTLTQNEKLRGCIGTLDAHRSLLLDVKANAFAAAFKDPRFPALAKHELANTDIEISLLSKMQAMDFSSEHDALQQLRPGIDGVVFTYAHYRSTFLPQVWAQLPDVDTFMAHLKHKAGLHADFWHDEVKLMRYTVSKFKEQDLQPSAKFFAKE